MRKHLTGKGGILRPLAALGLTVVAGAAYQPAASAADSPNPPPGLVPTPSSSHTAARAATPAPGLTVKQAQRGLNRLGCQAGPANGTTSRHTRAAVMRFQSRERLRQSGYLDTATRRRLASSSAERCTARPLPSSSGHGRRVVVSQRQNWIWLVGPKGHVAAQAPMDGNSAVLHPGHHHVGSYCGRTARILRNHDDSGRLVLQHFVRFARCGIGFHRMPLTPRGHQIHPDWILGTNLAHSHGCVRLSGPFSKKVWRFAHLGTSVVVVRG